MKEFITNKRKCKGKIKSAGTNPAEIFLSDCILTPNCYKNRIPGEFLPGGGWWCFSLFVVGGVVLARGRKLGVGGRTGRQGEGLLGTLTTTRTPIYNFVFTISLNTIYSLFNHIQYLKIILTLHTINYPYQTLSEITDPHNKKAQDTQRGGGILYSI